MKLEPDVAALALSCGVHPLAIQEEYIGGLQRFAASCAALAQQAEPDHETRAELAEQQVVQLAEERDHYRSLWQKAQQAEPTPPDATAGLVDDLCLLHMGWKTDAEGDLYRAAWGRVIARAKQLKAQVGKGEEK